MNNNYIKDYRDKELKQYILASFFIVIAAIGLCMYGLQDQGTNLSVVLETLSVDILEGAICILVFIFTELWGNIAKVRIVYGTLPSNSIFSDIGRGKIRSIDFDVKRAKTKYQDLSQKSGDQQTEAWNKMLLKARKEEVGSVIEAERSQLLTRDICLANVTLFFANVAAYVMVAVALGSFPNALRLFTVSFVYLIVMFFVTRFVAKSKAKRLVELVIKYDLLTTDE